MADPDDVWNWASAEGILSHYLQLLESGTLSDAHVLCGKRTWKVHKAILCVRSEWFKKALTGPFQEATSRIIKITEFEENEVDCLLHYIYTGNINISKHFSGRAKLTASMSIWKMGDFFRLEDLCKIGLEGRERYFRRTCWLFSAKETTNSCKKLQISYITHLVQALYEERNHKVREAFRAPLLAFLLALIQYLAKTEEFCDLLRQIPDFASDWAVALTETMGSIKLPSSSPARCVKCAKSSSTRLDPMMWIKEKRFENYCRDCFPIQHLENWTNGGSKKT